ncbi:MAG: histidine phosphatase family protein [Leptolyngbyaceae cyanobacterium bins.349]|nr:histidine phosphatase family protein [Leptolyngbyaceae cyanobacterium bins.349]
MHRVLKLLFIRHAQSVGNVEKRMQGHGEFELSEVGQQQAEKLARRLLEEAWLPSHVYSSPLKRAAQTTQILVDYFQTAPLPAAVSDLIDATVTTPLEDAEPGHRTIAIQFADELKEFQNGIFQGLTWAEAVSQYPELCQQLEASPDWIAIPNAETLAEARSRSQRFIQSLLQQHRNGDHVWIVSHSWILQHLIAELMGCPRSWRLRASNTALFEFWIDRDRWERTDQNYFNTDLWQVRRFNDCQHLS